MRSCVKVFFLFTLLNLAGSSPVLAPPMRRAVPQDKWPTWLKEAVARPLPENTQGADAVVLHHEKIVEPLASGGVKVSNRLAVRLLLPSAVPKFEVWRVDYDKGAPRPQLRAWTIGPDGKAVAPDAEEDFVDLAAVAEGSLFVNRRIRGVEAPVPTPGSVVAYEDEAIDLTDRGAEVHAFGWVDLPVLFSKFTVHAPEGWSVSAVPIQAEGLELVEEEKNLSYTGRNIPAWKLEEHSPPLGAQLPHVWGRWFSPDGTRGFKDWESVGRFVENLTAPVLSQDAATRTLGQRLKEKAGGSLLDQLREAFEFTARQVRYVSMSIGVTGILPHPPDEVLKQLYGDCKDKTTFFRAIGRSWGLQVFPVFVKTADLGPLLENVPSMAQFNHVIVGVLLPEGVGHDLWATAQVGGVGRVLFLDATARENRAWDLREDVQGTMALIGIPGGAQLVRLPVQPPTASTVNKRFSATASENAGLSESSLEETWTGSQAGTMRQILGPQNAEERRKTTVEYLNRMFSGAVLKSYVVEGLDTVEAPVIERTIFSGGSLGKRLPLMLILEPGRIAGSLGPASLPSPPRRTAFQIGVPEQEVLDITILVPEGWVPEKLPAPQTLSTPELSVKAEWTMENGALRYKREASLLVQSVSAERYPAFRDDLLRLRRWDAGGIVFLKAPPR